MEETCVAGTRDSVEEGVSGALRNGDRGRDAFSIFHGITRVANTANGVIISVRRAIRDLFASSPDELGAINTDAGLEYGIIAFIFIAVRLEVALDTISIDITMISNIAFTGHTVISLIGSAAAASIKDPEVSFIAVALTILLITINTAILITATFSVIDTITGIADTAVSSFVPVTVKRTVVDNFANSIDKLTSIVADTDSIEVG